jgi:hypothetical protein
MRRVVCFILFLNLIGMPVSVFAVGISLRTQPYELVLFYSSSCTHCSQFCRTLRDYAWQRRMPVTPFKLTPKASPYFPNSVLVDQKTIEQYFGQGAQIAVPALFILNSSNMHLYPVSRGNLNYHELKERMEDLLLKIQKFERANG